MAFKKNKRRPTGVELEQMQKALEPGVWKNYKKFDMLMRKPKKDDKYAVRPMVESKSAGIHPKAEELMPSKKRKKKSKIIRRKGY